MPKSIFDDPEAEKELLRMLEEEEQQDRSEGFDADTIYEKLTGTVLGQEMLARRIAQKIEEASLAPRRSKPIISILICGPTGTGKTKLAKTLADAAFDEGEKYLYHLDCGSLGSSEASLTSVIGMSKGYVEAGKGALPQYLQTKGKGVLLFDEIEKAVRKPSDPLAQMLLALLDEGRVQSQYDMSKYSAKECIVIMTSNAMQREIAELLTNYEVENTEDYDELEEGIKGLLVDTVFAPEFLNRIDLVTSVMPLQAKDRLKIVELLMKQIAYEYDLEIDTTDKSVYFFIVKAAKQLKGKSGRDMERWIGDRLNKPIAEFKKAGGTNKAIVTYGNEKFSLAVDTSK